MKTTYHIGLDVHAQTVAIASAGADGSLDSHGSCSGSNLSVERALSKLAARLAARLGTTLTALKVCHEAGPTGFVLARRLLDLGVETTVVAPSLVPSKPGERIKTDTRDALKLARLHRAGELKPIRKHRERFRTITADNGCEFHSYAKIEARTGVTFYFANPHHSWERGTNENTNGLIRQYLPKGADLDGLSQQQCDRIAARLNARPRKRHNYQTPEEIFF